MSTVKTSAHPPAAALGDIRTELYKQIRGLWCAYSLIEQSEEDGGRSLLPVATSLMARSSKAIAALRAKLEEVRS